MESGSSPTIRVEVAYGTPARQALRALEIAAGSSVRDAIEASGIREDFPEIPEHPEAVGIFGRRVSPEQVLAEGDRVEIYRPLIADPREMRRKRAQRAD